jgi:subtilisin family serine protease
VPNSPEGAIRGGKVGSGGHSGLLDLVRLSPLMDRTSGVPQIVIGLIDGPVALEHPDLHAATLKDIFPNPTGSCSDVSSGACMHGTFVAGVLGAKRGSTAPAICPGCPLLLRPIFGETSSADERVPSATPTELAQAILDVVEAGARVINLSVALVGELGRGEVELGRVLDHAARTGVIVVAAAGNQGMLGSSVITRHPWVIPVVAYDLQGHVMALSNLGGSIGRRGVGAPGGGVMSLRAAGGSLTLSGTSVATPFVTGAIALLWSCFRNANAAEIKLAVSGTSIRRHTIAPPLLDAESAYETLAPRMRSISVKENANGI